jgi:hypothetical protein
MSDPASTGGRPAGLGLVEALRSPRRLEPKEITMSRIIKAPNAKSSKNPTKTEKMIRLMRRNNGATLADLIDVTQWQSHSVRGAISGTLKKKMGLPIVAQNVEGRGRVYRIEAAG